MRLTRLLRLSHLRLSKRPRMDVHMFRFLNLVAHLNILDPLMSQHILNARAMLWVRFQHLAYQAPACTRVEIVDRRWAGGYSWGRVGTSRRIRSE